MVPPPSTRGEKVREVKMLSTMSCRSYKINGFSTKERECGRQNPSSENQKHVKIFKKLGPTLVSTLVALSPICNPPAMTKIHRMNKSIKYEVVRTPGTRSKHAAESWFPYDLPSSLYRCASVDVYASPAQSVDVQRGASLFHQACVGCHDAGGNVIQPGATLFANDLQRNGVDTEEKIFNITYFGKGRMPGFGQECTPKGQCTFGPRLQDEEIKLLANFVKLQADQGWSDTLSSED